MISRHVQLAIDYPGTRVRVHEVLLLRILSPRIVAPEIDLQRVRGFAM